MQNKILKLQKCMFHKNDKVSLEYNLFRVGENTVYTRSLSLLTSVASLEIPQTILRFKNLLEQFTEFIESGYTHRHSLLQLNDAN